jgi:hypothetical protein
MDVLSLSSTLKAPAELTQTTSKAAAFGLGAHRPLSRASDVSRVSAETNVSSASVRFAKHKVSLKQLLSFSFPNNKDCSGRLFVLAEHGPLYQAHSYISCLCSTCQAHVRANRRTDPLCRVAFEGGHLTPQHLPALSSWLCNACRRHIRHEQHIQGGFRGRHIVNKKQLADMVHEADVSDLLAAFDRKISHMTKEQRHVITANLWRDNAFRLKHFTRDDVEDLVRELPRDDDDLMDFYAVKAVIEQRRADRMAQLRMMYAPVVPKRRLNMRATTTDTKQLRDKAKASYRATQLTRRQLQRKMPDQFCTEFNSKLLHHFLHQIVGLADANTADLAINCHLLRHQDYDGETAWQGAVLTGARGAGTRVKRATGSGYLSSGHDLLKQDMDF